VTIPIADGDVGEIVDRRRLIFALLLVASGRPVRAADAARIAAVAGLDFGGWSSGAVTGERDGLLAIVDDGRGRWVTGTDAGRGVLEAIARRFAAARAGDIAGRGWDGRWRLIALPDERGNRDETLRCSLLELGGASLNDRVIVLVRDVPDGLLTGERLALARSDQLIVGSSTAPREIAARLWPLDEVAARYRSFNDAWVARADRIRAHGLAVDSAARLALELFAAFWDCFEIDPALPPELLPRPWPGRQARNLLSASFRSLKLHSSDRAITGVLRAMTDAFEPAG
jgi:phenylacetic acid degradation operon negative regulatory protein